MIREATMQDIDACTELAFQLNTAPETSCAYCSRSREAIRRDWREMVERPEHRLFVREKDREILACFGFYVDPEKNTADCVGPFVLRGDYMASAVGMLDAAKKAFPRDRVYNFFFDIRNRSAGELMEAIGARREDNEYILGLKREEFVPVDITGDIRPFSTEFASSLAALHDRLFPGNYVSGRDILETIGKGRRAFCAFVEEAFAGYVVIRAMPGGAVGTLEILAVEEAFRGVGLGRELLSTGLAALFQNPETAAVELVVDKLNTGARQLYFSQGFQVIVENHAYTYRA